MRIVAARLLSRRMSRRALRCNAKLNASEAILRQRIGPQKVDELIRQFKVAAVDDPRLLKALYARRDPYRWIAQYWAPKQQCFPQPQPQGGAP